MSYTGFSLLSCFIARRILKQSMLKAIIFDCDGVIADTEPIHLAGFKRVLTEEGITLSDEDYFEHYLALDDRGCFTKVFAQHRPSMSQTDLNELITRKAGYVEQAMKTGLTLLPGAAEFIHKAAARYPLAVASGALRVEVETVVNRGGLRDCFRAIVAAQDTSRSKPYPDPFIKALELLNKPNTNRIEARECLVVEDSIHGIRAAQQAGMRCLAVTNSYSREKLSEAELVVDSLLGLSLKAVESLFDA
jgi:HAD superfamily hydrolase (TIGR01509 family)